MKVSMVNAEKNRGGAARIASLLAKSINETCDGISTTLYHSQDNIIDGYSHGLKVPASRYLNALLARIGGSHCIYDFGLTGRVLDHTKDSDILHIHNLHGYYLDWKKLLLATANQPVVWTWHDQWGATGRCGAAGECNEWQSECKICPHLDYYPKAWVDKAHAEFQIKSHVYNQLKHLHIVSPSQWLADIAIKRGFSSTNVSVIPNPVDVSSYVKRDKHESRKMLDLPQDKFIALFIAADCNDPRKGYFDFIECVKDVPVLPLVVGKEPVKKYPGAIYAGEIREQKQLSVYYSAADVMVFTSKADNYPNTIIESLICGTPVCAYSVGGVKSQLHTNLCKLVDFGDVQSIRKYLIAASGTDGKTVEVSAELEKYAKNMWSSNIIAKKYCDLYQEHMGTEFLTKAFTK